MNVTTTTVPAPTRRSPFRRRSFVAAITAAAAFGVLTASPASAVTITTVRSGTGTVLRAIFFEDGGFGGDQIRYYGSGRCSSSTTDTDFTMSVLPAGWNDRISSVKDYNYCDVKLYWDGGATGTKNNPRYINYGTSGMSVPLGWNDEASSFRVS